MASRPWAQKALQFTGAWQLTRGRGITVAVIDSGVDYSPQLAHKVRAISLTGRGLQDCVGHGTAVAGIIAAADQRAQGMPFVGVAPDASILSIKVDSTRSGTSATLAKGIRYAVHWHAKVINISSTTRDSPELRAAVRYALRRNVVVVAAAGNDTPNKKGPFYPASYPGVISVGAVSASGALAPFSDRHSQVAVTAPGANVTSAWPGGYQAGLSGTSFAAPFVSGVAALVRARFPRLTAAQVARRIEATANGGTGPGTGNGLVNAVQAVSAILPSGARPGASHAIGGPVSVARPSAPPRTQSRIALGITAASLAAALLAGIAAVVISQGRRRRWRPGRVGFRPDDSAPS